MSRFDARLGFGSVDMGLDCPRAQLDALQSFAALRAVRTITVAQKES